jgi:biotin carboxylase
MKERIIILGAGVMQGPAIRIAKDMGLETYVLDADPKAPCVYLADHFECIDLKDVKGIENFARELQENGGLAGIMTAGTDFSASVAWTAEKLGLPGISYETALDASDKQRMRTRFKKSGVPSPQFTIVKDVPNNDFSLPFDFPVVVKPVDNMGSRGCRIAANLNDLVSAVQDALRFSRSGRVIIEEYMDGPEFSVDAIVFDGEITICGLADRHIFFPPYFIEMGHTMPTNLDEKTQEAILNVFSQGVKALGIQNGAAKGDMKFTSRGPMIGEIAARLSGGYMSGWTYPYSSGVKPARGAIMAALGKRPDQLKRLSNRTSAERAFISIPGTVSSITGIDDAKNIPHIKDIFMRIEQGKQVVFPENNVSKCGNIISAAENREDAIHSAELAAQSILIRLEFPNAETEQFLNSWTGFPPNAFSLDENLLKRLGNLPSTNISQEKKLFVYPFPEFTSQNPLDYMGRNISQTFAAISRLTGYTLEIAKKIPTEFPKNADLQDESFSHQNSFLGREFWQNLIRGGYQGAVYYLDALLTEQKS